MNQYLQNHLKPALEFLKVEYPEIGQQTQVQDISMIHLSFFYSVYAWAKSFRIHWLAALTP